MGMNRPSSRFRIPATALVAAFLIVLFQDRCYPSTIQPGTGPKESVQKDPVERSLRLSVRLYGARKDGKRASYFKSVARQRMTRRYRTEGTGTTNGKDKTVRPTSSLPPSSGR